MFSFKHIPTIVAFTTLQHVVFFSEMNIQCDVFVLNMLCVLRVQQSCKAYKEYQCVARLDSSLKPGAYKIECLPYYNIITSAIWLSVVELTLFCLALHSLSWLCCCVFCFCGVLADFLRSTRANHLNHSCRGLGLGRAQISLGQLWGLLESLHLSICW